MVDEGQKPAVISALLKYRTTDAMRGVLEKTRSDLTLTIRQKALEDRLNATK